MSFFQTLVKPIRKLRQTQKQISQFLKWLDRIKPIDSFDKLPQPFAPEYNNLDNWAAHPEKEDKSSFVPEGVDDVMPELQADVFFIHPTTFFGNKSWNAPLDHVVSREFVDEIIIPGQSSVFNSCCRIFAPRYRQATFYSFMEGASNSRRALELAFSDVVRAFDHYIKNHNNGRPFFVAAHSQGALHSVRLIEQKIENTALKDQFVAGYSIGFRFPKEKFGTDFKNIQAGTSAKQTGCIVAWDTYVKGGKPSNRLERREHWYPTPDGKGEWKRVAYKAPLCVNPLNWSQDLEEIPEGKNIGAVNAIYDRNQFNWDRMYGEEPTKISCSGLSKPFEAEVSAQCKEDGFLYISTPKHMVFRAMLLPRGNYHMYDYALFYMNIRKNIRERLESFLNK